MSISPLTNLVFTLTLIGSHLMRFKQHSDPVCISKNITPFTEYSVNFRRTNMEIELSVRKLFH